MKMVRSGSAPDKKKTKKQGRFMAIRIRALIIKFKKIIIIKKLIYIVFYYYCIVYKAQSWTAHNYTREKNFSLIVWKKQKLTCFKPVSADKINFCAEIACSRLTKVTKSEWPVVSTPEVLCNIIQQVYLLFLLDAVSPLRTTFLLWISWSLLF